jgi:two-component system response regulator PilR (NtrC family)
MRKQPVLVVDDEPDLVELVSLTLERMGLEASSAGDLATARSMLKAGSFGLCLTDMRLPDGDGLDLVAWIQENRPALPVAVITAHGNVEAAVRALKLGAFDFVSKPLDLAVLRGIVGKAMQLSEAGGSPARNGRGAGTLIGDSPAMHALRDLIQRVARSQAPVYVAGESGVGKELVARLIHSLGPRRDAPFVPVNCGAIPSELIESELFGHRKGSFTGAQADRVGLVQSAEGGTLFLDEVADLPLHLQVKLLRVLQEKAIRRVGDTAETPVDVRVVSATHRNLAELVEQGKFREDLYYRINVIELRVPPLRERLDDLPDLVAAILARLGKRLGTAPVELTDAAMERLREYPFPGNVRELENVLERAVTLCDGTRIEAGDIKLRDLSRRSASGSTGVYRQLPGSVPDTPPPAAPAVAVSPGEPTTSHAPAPDRAPAPEERAPAGLSGPLDSQVEELERAAIVRALEQTRYNRTAAARLLGMTFRALRYRIKKLGIE